MHLDARVLVGLAAVALLAAGCGDDDETDTSAATTETPAMTATEPTPAPATTTEPADEAAPAAGGAKLTAAQKDQLLTDNNTAVLGENGHAEVADNYRTIAEPLAEGACKSALTAIAAAEDDFAEALDADKPLAERQKLGQEVLKGKTAVDDAC